ncbi:ABC transporter permease [Portibacter lacus]|uniref:ABC transporter permease n=1 Tax=Portibacter lacus TaxID=1099794 RepID=UPI001F2676E2|nr:ABC transporter permease [Portibacter lacus]
MSKAVPGDPVDDRLALNFDTTFEGNYEKEYARLKKELFLDLPYFYFALAPNHFPKDIQALASKADVQAKRKDFFSDRGLFLPTLRWHGLQNQYHKWLFNSGLSISDGSPVNYKIKRAMVWTVFLVLTSIIFSYFFGIGIGLLLSSIRSKKVVRWLEGLLFGIYAIPVFWLATLLLVFFTTKEYGAWTNIFPTVGLSPIDVGDPWYLRLSKYGSQLILPTVVLVLHNLAFISTLTKRNIDKSKKMGFVTTSKAYGFSKKEVLFKEVLPFSLIPLITSVTSAIPAAISGSLVIEIIFNIPGMGRLLYKSILNYDWPVVFPVVMIIACFTFLSFLIADILYRTVDPRIS